MDATEIVRCVLMLAIGGLLMIWAATVQIINDGE